MNASSNPWKTSTGQPYVIAEIGVNHEGDLDTARRLIELAAEGGADAAKFQTYKAETLASRNSPAYWDTTQETTMSQYELFQKYDTFEAADYRALADHCRHVGIAFLSTPFDLAAVDMLDPLVPFFKVASADITNIPLLRRVGITGKPILISTGASTVAEVEQALRVLQVSGAGEVAVMHCVLAYPTKAEDAHLRMITGLRAAFPDRAIGYSDHTVPGAFPDALLVGWLLGATILEKHFTHDKSLPGNDHYHAMDVHDLAGFRRQVDRAQALLGVTEDKAPVEAELAARLHARRSLVAARELPAGTLLTADDLICKRPGNGITADPWDEVLGATLRRGLAEDDVLRWEDVRLAPDRSPNEERSTDAVRPAARTPGSGGPF